MIKIKSPYLILFAFITALLSYHIFAYIGHYGYDDLQYAELAHGLTQGALDYNDHFSFRTPLILLTALSYKLFGLNDFASSLPALLMSTCTMLLVFALLKKQGNQTLILGLTLTCFSHWFIFYSDKLMPDIYMALAVLAVLFVLHQYFYKPEAKQPLFYAILFALSLLFGFTAKGTIVLLLPVLLYFFVLNLIQRRHFKFWLYSIAAGGLVFTLYFVIIWWLTGDVFKRFDAIADNSYLNLCSYDQQSFWVLVQRLVYVFFNMLVYQGMAPAYIFILAHIISRRSFQFFSSENSFSFWLTAAVLLLLSSNFMTISYSAYIPMCIDPRHYLFLIPIAAIPASQILSSFLESKQAKFYIISIAGVLALLALFLPGDSFWRLYFPLFALTVLYAFIAPSKRNQRLFISLFIAILLIKPLSMIHYAQGLKYKEQRKVFQEQVLVSGDSCTVVTNDVQKRLGAYYQAFDTSGRVKFYNYKEFEADTSDTARIILFRNWYTRYLTNTEFHELPYYAKNVHPNNRLLYENEALNIEVFEMSDFTSPQKNGKELLYSLNTFEKETTFWVQEATLLNKKVKFQGETSIQTKEFSARFEFPMDKLDNKGISQISIQSSLQCYFENQTNALLVMAIEHNGESYIWEGIKINKHLKAYSNWWPIKHEINIEKRNLKEGSILKIYVWNQDKQKGYIDDFEVRVVGN